ncbi:MAG: PE family protein [Mycobacterium sp.]|nr:PE family protein [Mycobacterium sp.]
MSFVIAVPETATDAATSLASIGSTITKANAAAAAPTTAVLAAAEDEVSAAVASLFSGHAQQYQALSAQAAAFHSQLVQTLTAGACAYAGTEAANVEQMLLGAFQPFLQETQPVRQALLGVINAPTEFLLGRPLIGPGANGATNRLGVGMPGGAGGILWGRGGNGGNSTAAGAPGGAGGPAGLLGTGGTGGMGGPGAVGGSGGAGGLLYGHGGPGGIGGPLTITGVSSGGAVLFSNGGPGGAGGPAGLLGAGGTGGMGQWGAPGGAGGISGWLYGHGGPGGIGGPLAIGGSGGSAVLFGKGGPGGVGGELARGGSGGHGGWLVGTGGPGGTGGVLGPGGPGGPGGMLWGKAGPTGAAGGPATAPMYLNAVLDNGQPREITYISIESGPSSPVIVDTGSQGLLVTPPDVNGVNLGQPIGTGSKVYNPQGSTTHTYAYTEYNASVNFAGTGIVTQPMTIGVINSDTVTTTKNGMTTSTIYTWSPSQSTYVDPAGDTHTVVGVMGVGVRADGVGFSPVQELPGTLNQGVLLNNPQNQLQFGANPLSYYASLPGGAKTSASPDLLVQVTSTASPPPNPGTTAIPATPTGAIDSGGIYGGVPQSALPNPSDTKFPAGDTIWVYTSNNPGNPGTPALLYSATVNGPGLPDVYTSTTNTPFNSGVFPFSGYGGGLVLPSGIPASNGIPIYVAYSPSGTGTTYFDS